MFPFLAPIRAPSTRCRISLDPNRPVEMIFYSDIPSLEVPSERVRNASGSSGSSRSTLDTNRPKSRDITKSPSGLSQMSARSAKSSPIPPPVSEVVPPYQRHKNKGLETSSAMMELFGGAPSYSSSSAVQKIPSAPTDSFHGRKAFLQKELEERARWETAKESSSSTEPHFSQIEDHVAAYHRATTRAGRKQPDNKFDSQPGPEYETFEEKQDEEEAACPAAKLIGEMEAATLSSPKRSPVLDVVPLDQPGPDLGDEDEADGSSSIGRDPDDESQRDAAVVDAEETTEQDDESTGEGGPMLVIRGAQVVNDDSIFSADVLVQDGVIKNVGMGLEIPDGCQVIEATGKLLIPAGIDVHTHLSAPESCDDVPTGCRAALAGGTATIVDLVVPNGGESLSAAISRVKKSFDSASCNYAFSVVINSFSESVQKEMDKVVAEGVNSFVVDVDSDDKLYQVLEVCHSLGAHARILPENKNIVSLLEKKMLSLGITGPEGYLQSRPVELEKERISNICLISQLTNCPVSILSVSSSEALESIEKARSNGAMTHPEIATAAVASSSAKYFEKDLKQAAAHMTDIPLRDDANRLVNALTSQPLAVCTSGHRAISSASRTSAHIFTNMATGVAGVEERMAVVWEKAVRNGRIDPMRFVAVTSTNAAKIFNLYPKKGRIAVGADADLVLWDTTIKRKLGASVGQSGEDVSLYDGFGVHAQAVVTVVGGRVAWKDGGLKDAQGEFIALSPNSPYLFSVVQHRDKTSNYEKVERETTSNGVNGSKKSFDNTPARPAVRKTHYDSNIVFGTESNRSTGTRDRNPPGGRSTNLW